MTQATPDLLAAYAALEAATRRLSDRYAGKVKRTARPQEDRMDLAGIDGILSRIDAARRVAPEPAQGALAL